MSSIAPAQGLRQRNRSSSASTGARIGSIAQCKGCISVETAPEWVPMERKAPAQSQSQSYNRLL